MVKEIDPEKYEEGVIDVFNRICSGEQLENIRKSYSSYPQIILGGVTRYTMYMQLGDWGPKFMDLLPKIQQTFRDVRTFTGKDKYIYPHPDNVFRAFNECPPSQTKVVILGMDPYHTPNMATGLAFHAPIMTPSLRNILKELKSNLDIDIKSIEHWPSRGVLLLNTALTVEQGKPGSHINLWKPVMKDIIQVINDLPEPIIWVLMGEHAKSWATSINPHHYIVTSPHPSPLSRKFIGSEVFTNIIKIANQANIKIDFSC